VNVTEAAKVYASLGWHTFPVQGKRPLVPWREASTTDVDAHHFWWEQDHPDAGIAVDCGKSGLVVIDVDNNESFESFVRQLIEDGELESEELDTFIQFTPSGGMHLVFSAPASNVKNSVSKLAQGVDVRAGGGYIVAHPSPNYNCNVAFDAEDISDVLRTLPAVFERLASASNETEIAQQPEFASPSGLTRLEWGERRLEENVLAIMNSQQGTRNQTLNIAALKVFRAVKGGHIDHKKAWDAVREAGLQCGLNATEVDRTMASAWGAAEPAHPEERELPRSSMQPKPETKSMFRALSIEEIQQLPPPQWLLKNRLPEGQTWIYGEPGAGKSFLALDWAASVASTGLNVIYFIGEGVTGFARRVSAWRSIHGRDLSTFRVVPQAPHLLDAQSVAALEATVDAWSPSLIIVDTFARSLVGGEENSARDVGMAINALDTLWRERKVSSLVIHHSNKGGTSERGSSAIRGAADATWEVTAGVGNDYQLGATATCRKMKDAEPPEPILFQLRSEADSAYVYPSASTLQR
jgi:hypothetical protein